MSPREFRKALDSARRSAAWAEGVEYDFHIVKYPESSREQQRAVRRIARKLAFMHRALTTMKTVLHQA